MLYAPTRNDTFGEGVRACKDEIAHILASAEHAQRPRVELTDEEFRSVFVAWSGTPTLPGEKGYQLLRRMLEEARQAKEKLG